MKKIIFCAVVFILAGLQVSAQTININKHFGKVSKEEVQMTTYQLDTAASALVLYEKQDVVLELTATGEFILTRDVHMRIKVLKEDGIEWGNFEIMKYSASNVRETVTGIEVDTYNISENGIERVKMSRDYIYDEQVSESWRKVSFYAQDVRVGSVIEVKYKVTSNMFWDFDDLVFQKSIPVNLSEAEVRIPGMFTFNKKLRGSHDVGYETDMESRMLGAYQYGVGVDKFRSVDIPAFKYEKFVYHHDQFFLAVTYDIRSLSVPPSTYQEFSVTWDDVDESYRNADLMTRFRSNCHFKDEVALIAEDLPDAERIAEAVRIVKSHVEWNGRYTVSPEPLAQVIKSGAGTNADINCLIAGCLKEMGYEANLIMLKARTSGHLLDFQPERFPYDTFVVGVVGKDGKEYYLDGGSWYGYLNVLPPNFLVPNARMIRNNGPGQWVDLTRLSRNSTIMNVSANLTDDMRISGEAVAKYTGNPSTSKKTDYMGFEDEDEFIADMESDYHIDIEDISFSEMKDYSASSSINWTFTKDVGYGGQYVYISPFLTRFHAKDSFQELTRQCPVDFPYPYNVTYMFTFMIPEGYQLDGMPENRSYMFEPLGATVRCIYALRGNSLQVVFNYSQTKMFCEAVHYEDLRTFWQYLAQIYEETVVLKKM